MSARVKHSWTTLRDPTAGITLTVSWLVNIYIHTVFDRVKRSWTTRRGVWWPDSGNTTARTTLTATIWNMRLSPTSLLASWVSTIVVVVMFSITAKNFFFRYYLSSAGYVCMYVCMCVFAITATPFNLELSNFGLAFLMWISKNGFLKILNIAFCWVIAPFLYYFKISL